MGSEDFRPEKFFSYHRKILLVSVAIRSYAPPNNRNPEKRGISRKTVRRFCLGKQDVTGLESQKAFWLPRRL